MEPFTKRDIQKDISEFIRERGWDKKRISDLAKSISIEAAELLEHWQWNEDGVTKIKRDLKRLDEIHDEIADVLIYAIEMCIALNISYQDVVTNKLKKNEKRYSKIK